MLYTYKLHNTVQRLYLSKTKYFLKRFQALGMTRFQGREVAVLGATWSSSWVSGPGGKVGLASLRAWV